jgi:hypothetical protein
MLFICHPENGEAFSVNVGCDMTKANDLVPVLQAEEIVQAARDGKRTLFQRSI